MPTKTNRKHGTVQAFNISPKGSYEGLLMESGGNIIQVNFSPEYAMSIEQTAPIGQAVELEVEPADTKEKSVHPVYRLLSIHSKNGRNTSSQANANNNGHFSGEVARLNYALHGEVNGGILDTGDFLHLKPHGAAAVELAVGMKVQGTGHSKPMTGGHRVIDADEINGIAIEHKPKPKKKAAHH